MWVKRCKHFGECGGCSFQDIPYKKQLWQKQEKIKELMASYGIAAPLKPINHSRRYYYRNKMEFTFADQGKIACGFYGRKEKRELVDLEECIIFSSDAGKILKMVKNFARKKNYSVYNKYSHKGFLRNLIIREAKFTKEIMVGIAVTSEDELAGDEFVKELTSLKLKAAVKSIYQIINNSLSDAVVFEKKKLLWGTAFIKEKIGRLIFKIGIDTFSQVNPFMIKGFYEKIRSYAKLSSDKSVVDLFCGAGSIGLFLARYVKFVWGVEFSKETVEAAWENAKINKVGNISFLASDTRKFLNTHSVFHRNISLLIVNPPRCGLSNKVIRGILRLNPEKIIFSSCNPDAFCRDISALKETYKPNFIEPFDFFPHTPHLECLSLLSKIQ
ncbi:MAG: 23S rRNA (uracil(1939)-C(5))-methyltransferase RlmD [Candidatus Omnitrophota bacterium]